MSCVHVLVGQCGNQLGTKFLNGLIEEARTGDEEDGFAEQVSSLHFRPSQVPRGRRGGMRNAAAADAPPLPRSVMIDMEPKVIEGILNNAGSEGGAYRPHERQCITRDEGSANNWAFGYFHQGRSRKEDIRESLRCESESSGTIGTFHVVHSVAGGTGSGVGCLVADIVREEFPHSLLLHSVVWPFSTGEVVTQWYNCVMAMSALRDTADAVFMAHNDDFGDAATTTITTTTSGGGKKGIGNMHRGEVSFTAINDSISRLMVDMHLPRSICHLPQLAAGSFSAVNASLSSLVSSAAVDRYSCSPQRPRTLLGGGGGGSHAHFSNNPPLAHPLRRGSIADIVESVALDPTLKFFSGVAVPVSSSGSVVNASTAGGSGRVGDSGSSLSWQSVVRHAARKSVELFPPFSRSLSNEIMSLRSCLWSLRGPNVWSEGIAALQEVMSSSPPFSPTNHIFLHEKSYRGHAAHVSLFGPSRNIGVRLSTALERTEQLLSLGAFMHHFSRYGVEADDVRNAVLRLWDTAAAYTSV